MLIRIIVAGAIAFAGLLSGCAEFRNRGGTVDWIEDKVLFKADTKSLRVMRSYVIIGGLSRLATTAPMDGDERSEFARRMYSALGHVYEAYACVQRDLAKDQGTDSVGCNFFDDRMAVLDAATLRLARSVFLPKENVDLLALVQKEALGTDVIDDIFGTGAKVVDAASATANTALKQVDIINTILKLGRRGFQTSSRLGPIYRDAIELELRILRDAARAKNAVDAARIDEVYQDGAGALADWHALVRELYPQYGRLMSPAPKYFAEVSELIWRACENLVVKADDLQNCRAYYGAASPKSKLLYGAKVEELRNADGKGGREFVQADLTP